MLGQMVSVQPCPDCRGQGEIIEDRCTECRGEGRVRNERTLEIEVPPGVSSDDYLKLRGQGSVGPKGGPRGHLVVELNVEPDPRFTRDGDDLIHELAVTFGQAALGDTVQVPTIEPADVVSLPKGQAFALLEGGQLWKVRMPLPLPDKHEDIPGSIAELAERMKRDYTTGEQWWTAVMPPPVNLELSDLGTELSVVGNEQPTSQAMENRNEHRDSAPDG